MSIEKIGIGESIQATVTRAAPDLPILPIILLFSLIFFIFLCYMAWNKRNDTQSRRTYKVEMPVRFVRQFKSEE